MTESGDGVGRETCDECGFDAMKWTQDRARVELAGHADEWRDVLGATDSDAVHRRPDPAVWSAVEYAVHTARVVEFWCDAIDTVGRGDRIHIDFAASPDADVFPYNDTPAADAVDDLAGQVDRLREHASALDESEWRAPLRFEHEGVEAAFRSEGIHDVGAGLLHAIHDALHHLGDVRRGLAA